MVTKNTARAPIPKASGKSRTVLIIEDEEFIRDLITMKFAMKGYAVLAATTVEAGRLLLEKTAVDLICLDILLPMQDGFSFLAELKADERFKHIPVFINKFSHL